MNFKDTYQKTTTEKKLNFLTQLLEKDTSLQQQFIAFIKEDNLDKIAGVDIDKLRDEIWKDISLLDIDDIMNEHLSCHEYYYYNDDGGMGYEILEDLFNPYIQKSLDYLDKGNYLDAFRVILAIYELQMLEVPDVEDDNYYVFGDDIISYIEVAISDCFDSFNDSIENKVVSTEMVKLLINLLFERYLNNEEYNLYNFNDFIKAIVNEKSKAQYLLDTINNHNLNSYESAIILTHIAKILEDDTLFLEVSNKFYIYNRDISIELLKKYKELNQDNEFARVAKELLEKEDSYRYTHLIIENINKDTYTELYIKALKLHISYKRSIEHYKLLREYLDNSERLEFIKKFKKSYEKVFYIKLLEIEEQYPMILDFVQKHNDSYELLEMLKPILSIYPNEVLQIIIKHCNRLIDARGRDNYNSASQLLSLLFNSSIKSEELTDYIQKIYNHKPNLPALKDELNKAGLI